MKHQLYSLALLFFAACARPPAPAEKLYAAFETLSAGDTLHFFLADSIIGRPVSDSLLRLCLDSIQFNCLHYETGDAQFYAAAKRALTADTDACLLYTRELWFGRMSLLFYDHPSRRFFGVQEVGSFYGGDGGQAAVESWMLQYNDATHLYVKTAQHGFIPGEEPKEYYDEAGVLLRWEGRAFQPVLNSDSTAWLSKFRMDKAW